MRENFNQATYERAQFDFGLLLYKKNVVQFTVFFYTIVGYPVFAQYNYCTLAQSVPTLFTIEYGSTPVIAFIVCLFHICSVKVG